MKPAQRRFTIVHSMFDSSLPLQEAHKPALADTIWVLLGSDVQADVPNKDSRYVLDGVGGTHSTNLNGLADLHTDASSTSTLSM